MEHNNIPDEIKGFVWAQFSDIIDVRPLQGIKQEISCYKIRFKGGAVCAKRMPHRDALFLKHISSGSLPISKHVPKVVNCLKQQDDSWVLMEFVPHEFPPERRGFDQDKIEVLYILHNTRWSDLGDPPAAYVPGWSAELTRRFLACASGREGIEPQVVEELQKSAQVLFKAHATLHGDTNPTNWRLREDGTPVLLDWERLCKGSPAIDLAITMPGLGTADLTMETEIAKAYLRLLGGSQGLDEMVYHIKLAKIWSAIEFTVNTFQFQSAQMLDYLFSELSLRMK